MSYTWQMNLPQHFMIGSSAVDTFLFVALTNSDFVLPTSTLKTTKAMVLRGADPIRGISVVDDTALNI